MKKIIFLLCFLVANANAKTYLIDFDAVFYDINRNESYFRAGYSSAFKKSDANKKELQDWLYNVGHVVKSEKEAAEFVGQMRDKFKVKLEQDDLNLVVEKINRHNNKSAQLIIRALIDDGDKVVVIGGGTFGCYVLSEVMQPFGVLKENIYSGYFKDFSDAEIGKAIFNKHNYVNCGEPEKTNFVAKNKEDLTDYLQLNDAIKIGYNKKSLEPWILREQNAYHSFGIKVIK